MGNKQTLKDLIIEDVKFLFDQIDRMPEDTPDGNYVIIRSRAREAINSLMTYCSNDRIDLEAAQAEVDGVADSLNAVASGNTFVDEEGNFYHPDDSSTDDIDGRPVTMKEYLELDLRGSVQRIYRDKTFVGAKIAIALGGPFEYIDTENGEVILEYSGGMYFKRYLRNKTVDEINRVVLEETEYLN